MSAVEALRVVRENGVQLGVAGTDLILDAGREPAPHVLEAIRRHKADIVAQLTSEDIPGHEAGLSRGKTEKKHLLKRIDELCGEVEMSARQELAAWPDHFVPWYVWGSRNLLPWGPKSVPAGARVTQEEDRAPEAHAA